MKAYLRAISFKKIPIRRINKFGACGKGKNIRLYNWALDADGIQFEKGQYSYILLNRNIKKKYFFIFKGVGIKVSGRTKINYLVLSIHYNDKLPIDYVDNESAYNITLTTQE